MGIETFLTYLDTTWKCLKKLETDLPNDLAIQFRDVHPKGPKILHRKDVCTPRLTKALYTIAKIWKHPECLRTDT